ncbi:MAG: aldehyde ferredoxin oxidoreductase N-terminal domain-containing protein, partial [Desulfomonilia bacterium]
MDVLLKPFYNHRFVHVDLTASTVEGMPVPKEMLVEGIGGTGITRLLHSRFSDGDPIVLGCGPLSGSFAPASCLMVATFSPDSRTLCHVPFLVNAGPQLKFSGMDFLVITGHADQQIMLEVMNGTVRISRAETLTGSISERESILLAKGKYCPEAILLTGQAAETGSPSAVVSSGLWGSLDKAGLGSFAEGKNIRAITLLASGGVPFLDGGRDLGESLMKTLRNRHKKRQYVVQDMMASG